MRQPRHAYSSLNTTIHHRAQKQFAVGKVFNPRQPRGVILPRPAGVLATAVPGSRERRDDHAAAGQAGAGESPAGSLSLRGLPRRCRGSFSRNCRPSSRCACECPPGRPGTRRRPGRASGDRDRPRRRRSGPVAAIRIRWPGPAGAVRVRATGRPGFPRSRCGRTGDGADAAPRSRLRGAGRYRPGWFFGCSTEAVDPAVLAMLHIWGCMAGVPYTGPDLAASPCC